MRALHITGIYEFADGSLKSKKLFSVEEQDALIHAKAVGDAAAIEKLGPFEDLSITMLDQVERTRLREANIALTKQSIRESVKPDLLIINTINTIEELDKVCNALSKRLREWYALYDPELEHAYKEHQAFTDAILTRTSERASDTMGGSFSEIDIQAMHVQAQTVSTMYKSREELLTYLEQLMQQHTPNIKRVAGSTIGAKLLSMAGSLERFSRMPSSTIQLLGAETALFRHLRNRKARPPKHGIIFNHVLMQRAQRHLRGKVARALADKISIAAKVDYFKGEYIGDKLYTQVEEKL
jgi:nucleolar protein 56